MLVVVCCALFVARRPLFLLSFVLGCRLVVVVCMFSVFGFRMLLVICCLLSVVVCLLFVFGC